MGLLLVGRSTAQAKAAVEIALVDGEVNSQIFRVGLVGIVIATLGDRLKIAVGVGVNVRDGILWHIDVTGSGMSLLVDDVSER